MDEAVARCGARIKSILCFIFDTPNSGAAAAAADADANEYGGGQDKRIAHMTANGLARSSRVTDEKGECLKRCALFC
jgi:hypothetical protein